MKAKNFPKVIVLVIFGDQVINISNDLKINEDYWRYYLVKIRPETHDSSFDWKDFIISVQSDLVNNIGNFVNRCVSMSEKFCENVTYHKITNFQEPYNI